MRYDDVEYVVMRKKAINLSQQLKLLTVVSLNFAGIKFRAKDMNDIRARA
jgi:hypothetical protein